MSHSTPHLLGNRYELLNRIGIGGMAEVYLARDVLLGRNVAVKILDERSAADPAFVERFKREARAAAGLNHANVVTIYDWGQTPSGPDGSAAEYYMVMEYVPGDNLKDVIVRRGHLPETEALEIGRQIASALEAAHRQGLVHRDVKPHNVLLDPLGVVKVADFGIAHAAGLSQLTATNAVSGTAHYLSPEQAQRRPMDGRSDVYSLGIVLYEMLTGRVPFDGSSLIDVALQHVKEPPLAPHLIRPEVSPATEAVVLRALAKDPDRRYHTAAELRDALIRSREGLAPVAVAPADETVVANFQQGDATTYIPPPKTVMLGTLKPGRRPRLRAASSAVGPPRITAPVTATTGRRPLAWMIIPVALVLLLIGIVALHAFNGPSHPRHVAGGAGVAHATRTRAPVRPSATTLPQPPPTKRPVVVVASTATSRPAPTATSLPVPTPTVAASVPTATAIPQPTTQVAAASSGQGDPVNAVVQFYNLVSQQRFRAAARLWTSGMRQQFPVATNIDGRFRGERITVRVHLIDKTSHRADVGVAVFETTASGTSELDGSWSLVPDGNGGWLLAYPSFG